MAAFGFFKRHPGLRALLALEFALFFIVAYQIQVDGRISLLEKIALAVFGPIQDINQRTLNSIDGFFEEGKTRAELSRENRQLKEDLSGHQTLRDLYEEAERENRRLKRLLDMADEPGWREVYARVVGRAQRRNDYMITIDKGARQGVRSELGVYSPDGVVGVVWEVSGGYAKVITVNNPSSVIAAMVQSSRYQETYVSGLGGLKGVLKNFPAFEQVHAHDLVLTSGLDRVFPKGLHIGRITRGMPSADMFQEVEFLFSTDFSRLEEVIVLIPECAEEFDELE